MRIQKNGAGAVLNIPPRFVQVPVERKGKANQLVRSTSLVAHTDEDKSGNFSDPFHPRYVVDV